jgi:hypothetical protein
VTVDENAFEIITSRIKNKMLLSIWNNLLFAYKLNFETIRPITDPNDDLSDAQATKVSLMQATQMSLLDYYNEFSQGMARGQMDYETGYTLAVTAASVAITVAASIYLGQITSMSQFGLQFIEQGVYMGATQQAVQQVTKTIAPKIVEQLVKGSAILAQAGMSIVKECAEEIFVDKFLGSVIEETVETLGGDEAAKVFWSTLGESFRESISGPISDTVGIGKLTEVLLGPESSMSDIQVKLAAQQELNEIQMELWEARVMNAELESTIADREFSRFLFTASSLSAEPTIDTARYSSGDVLHMTDTLIYDNMIGAVSIREMLTAVREAEILAADTATITTDSELALEQEIADLERFSLRLEYESNMRQIIATIEAKKFPDKDTIHTFQELYPMGYYGCGRTDPILEIMHFGMDRGMDVGHMTFWGGILAKKGDKKGEISMMDAIWEYAGHSWLFPEEISNTVFQTTKKKIYGEKRLKFTKDFRKWYADKYSAPLPHQSKRFKSKDLSTIAFTTELYSLLYEDIVKTHFSQEIGYKEYVEGALSKAVRKYAQLLIDHKTDNSLKGWVNSIKDYSMKDWQQHKEEILKKFFQNKFTLNENFDEEGRFVEGLLRDCELLFGVSAPDILREAKRKAILRSIERYMNTIGWHEWRERKVHAQLLDEFRLLQDLRRYYFAQTGDKAGFARLYEIMGFTDQAFDNHFRHENTASTDHMYPIQMFKIERWVRTSDILTEEQKRDLLEEHIHPWWERYEPTSVYHYQDSPTTQIISEILALWGDATGEVLSMYDLNRMIQQLVSTKDTTFFSDYTAPSGRYEFPNDATWNNNFKKFIKETFINSEENEKLFEDKKRMTVPEIERRA